MTSIRSESRNATSFLAPDGYPQGLDTLTGVDYAAALFTHSARLYPFAPSYLHSQLTELLGPCRKTHLNNLALSCLLLAQQVQPGKDPRSTLAMLARHHQYQYSAEFISRALVNDRYLQQQRHSNALLDPDEAAAAVAEWSLPFTLHDDIRPVPASLMRALLRWPDNDKLFTQALAILQRQPALASLVCRYATAYTPQGKQLELKPSLLLLGPQRSRELVLLAHFESNLSKPVFPMREQLLKRRLLIQHVLNRMALEFSVALPCRAELIAYLLVYDAWRSPHWTCARLLEPNPELRPWRVDSWLHNTKPANHRVALRLCQYWKMPEPLSAALRLQHTDQKVNAVLALSVASVHLINATANIHHGNDENHLVNGVLGKWLTVLDKPGSEPISRRYPDLVANAVTDAGYASELANTMRP